LIAVVVGVVIIAGGSFLADQRDGFLAYHSLLNWFRRDGAPTQTPAAQNPPCSLNPKPREFNREPYYTGKLYDSHLHLPTISGIVSSVSTNMGLPTPAWDKNLSTDYLNCLSEAEGVSKIFGFHLLTKYSHAGEVKIAREMEKKYPGRFVHFLMPTFINSWVDVEVVTVANILRKNPGLFVGLGEVKFIDGRSGPDDPKAHELYKLAREHKLIVMMHPFNRHKELVEKILREYPDVKFLFHGIDKTSNGGGPHEEVDNIEWVMKILRDYDNAYYSLGSQLHFYGFKKEHVGKAVPSSETLPRVRAEFNDTLDQTFTRWKRRIESIHDKFIGGETDRWHRPHFDAELSGLINEFIRSFIGGLDPSVREKFAYENAERLIRGAGTSLSPN